jgi:hypothetical protein
MPIEELPDWWSLSDDWGQIHYGSKRFPWELDQGSVGQGYSIPWVYLRWFQHFYIRCIGGKGNEEVDDFYPTHNDYANMLQDHKTVNDNNLMTNVNMIMSQFDELESKTTNHVDLSICWRISF